MQFKLTRHVHHTLMWVFFVSALITLILADSPRDGSRFMLLAAAILAGIFSLIYGLKRAWRSGPAATAVFWIIFAYFCMASHMTVYMHWKWYRDTFYEVQQFLYMGLALAGLNLMLTILRMRHEQAAAVAEAHNKLDRLLRQSDDDRLLQELEDYEGGNAWN